MNATIEKNVSTPRPPRQERKTIITNFDAGTLKAPFLLRVGALLIDYILIVTVPILFLIIGRWLGEDGSRLISGQLSGTGWLIAALVAVSDFLILPMFSGQTIGKMLTGLQIVKNDGHDADLKNLFIRHFIGYPLTLIVLPISFLMAIFSSSGKTPHDLIAGTIVVYGKRTFK